MATPRLRVLEIGLATRNIALAGEGRDPSLAELFAFANIEVAGRGVATGRASEPIRADSDTTRISALADGYVCWKTWGTAYEHHLRGRAVDMATPEENSDERFVRSVTRDIIDRAILDALLHALGLGLVEGMRKGVAGLPCPIYEIDVRRTVPSRRARHGTMATVPCSIAPEANAGEFTRARSGPDIGPKHAQTTAVVYAPADDIEFAAREFDPAAWPAFNRKKKHTAPVGLLCNGRKPAYEGLYRTVINQTCEEGPAAGNEALDQAFGPRHSEALYMRQRLALTGLISDVWRGRGPRNGGEAMLPAFICAPGFATTGIAFPEKLKWIN